MTSRRLAENDVLGVEDLLDAAERERLDRVRGYLRDEVQPIVLEHWTAGTFPESVIPTLADSGLAGVRQSGGSALLAGSIAAELARTDLSMCSFMGIHDGLVVGAIRLYGDDHQRGELIPELLAFRKIGAFALTEPDHGSDVAGGLECSVRREGDSWRLSGSKRWIGNALFDGYLIVLARDEESGAVRGFVVDSRSDGIEATLIGHKSGLRIVQNAHLVFSDVVVPESRRLPGIERFGDIAPLLRDSRILIGWQAVGVQAAAFDLAREYVAERRQFGRPLGSFQLVQSQLAAMHGNLAASRSMMAQVARLQDEDRATTEIAALVKAHTSKLARETVAIGRNLFGGNGLSADYGISKLFNDAEAIYTYEGTYEINTLIAGRAITGHSAFV